MKRFLILAAMVGAVTFAGFGRSAEAHARQYRGFRAAPYYGGYGYGYRGYGFGRVYTPGIYIATPSFQFGYGTPYQQLGYGPYYGGYGYGCRGW
jgi:hypothetical protein